MENNQIYGRDGNIYKIGIHGNKNNLDNIDKQELIKFLEDKIKCQQGVLNSCGISDYKYRYHAGKGVAYQEVLYSMAYN